MSDFSHLLLASETQARGFVKVYGEDLEDELREQEDDAWYDEAMAELEEHGEVLPEEFDVDATPLARLRATLPYCDDWNGVMEYHLAALVEGVLPAGSGRPGMEAVLVDDTDWLHRVSAEGMAALRVVADDAALVLARGWAQRERFHPDTAVEIIATLVRLAREASSGQSIYLHTRVG